jgi:hypothetical protein
MFVKPSIGDQRGYEGDEVIFTRVYHSVNKYILAKRPIRLGFQVIVNLELGIVDLGVRRFIQ